MGPAPLEHLEKVETQHRERLQRRQESSLFVHDTQPVRVPIGGQSYVGAPAGDGRHEELKVVGDGLGLGHAWE